MTGDASQPGEFALIGRFFAPLAASPGALGLKDDAALLDPPEGRQLVLTTDSIVAGIHYPEGETPGDIARRLLRVNLSDLAAMGARPEGYLLNVALPRGTSPDWIAGFCDGLRGDQQRFGITLLGGDTVATPGPAVFTLTAVGSVPTGRALRRGGGKAGDVIYVSGTIGDGVFGLWAVQGRLPTGCGADERASLARAFRYPEPRLSLGQRLSDAGLATAAADVSDGLLADLGHICEASGLGATVRASQVPLSTEGAALVGRDPLLLAEAMIGGDDYELVFTVAPEAEPELLRVSQDLGVAVTRIGVMDRERGVVALDAEGHEIQLTRHGFEHA